jgi:hypothetical protein
LLTFQKEFRKQTSLSYAADGDLIVCYGGAKLADKHLASKIHCVDDEIIEWLERRELRKGVDRCRPFSRNRTGQIAGIAKIRPPNA